MYIHFSVSLLWLIFCVYFYVSGRSIIFFHPGDVAFGGSCSMSPAVSSPLIIRATCSSIHSFVGFLPPSAVQVLTTVGAVVGRAGPYPIGCETLPCVIAMSLLSWGRQIPTWLGIWAKRSWAQRAGIGWSAGSLGWVPAKLYVWALGNGEVGAGRLVGG